MVQSVYHPQANRPSSIRRIQRTRQKPSPVRCVHRMPLRPLSLKTAREAPTQHIARPEERADLTVPDLVKTKRKRLQRRDSALELVQAPKRSLRVTSVVAVVM